jgi:hypothetical protein
VSGALSVIHNDNNYTFGTTIRNNNTTNTALTGLVINQNGTNYGQFVYCASNYIDTALQNTVLFSSVGLQKIAFVANASNSSTGGSDIYFKTRASNANNGIIVFGDTQNVGINTNTDSGFRLDVNGSARVSDNLTVSKNQNAVTDLVVSNTTNGAAAYARSRVISDSAREAQVFVTSSTWTPYGALGASTAGLYTNAAGGFAIYPDLNGSVKIITGSGGTNSVKFTLTSAGRLLLGTTTEGASILKINGLPTSATGLSAGDIWNDGGTLKIV